MTEDEASEDEASEDEASEDEASEDEASDDDLADTRHPSTIPQMPAKHQVAQWFSVAGLGMELAGITLLFMGFGFWIDRMLGARQGYATAFATLIGFAVAMTRFILMAVKTGKEIERSSPGRQGESKRKK